MCISPTNLPEIGPVACRFCWQCENNRVNDLVGRCIAEQRVSAKTLAITLTYRGDVPNSAFLVYKDVQDFLKRLRKKYGKVRYICAGEYGSKKGRAHWHIILFFKDKAPSQAWSPDGRRPWDYILPRWIRDPWARIRWKPWPHGISYVQEPDYGGFRYLLKYALKDQRQEVSTRNLTMSKKPPLGAEWVEQLAERYVAQDLAPQDLFYSFGDQFDSKGRRRRFMLQGKTRQNFLDHFVKTYEEVYQRPYPFSELLEEYEDSLINLDLERTNEQWVKDLTSRPAPAYVPLDPKEPDENTKRWLASEEVKGVFRGIDVTILKHPDETLTLNYGENGQWDVTEKTKVQIILDGLQVEKRQKVQAGLDNLFQGGNRN